MIKPPEDRCQQQWRRLGQKGLTHFILRLYLFLFLLIYLCLQVEEPFDCSVHHEVLEKYIIVWWGTKEKIPVSAIVYKENDFFGSTRVVRRGVIL